MEEVIYRKQIEKQATALRVIDVQQVDRHFNQDELMNIYNTAGLRQESRPEYAKPLDEVLAKLMANDDSIDRFHTHDEMLCDSQEEDLTEVEKREAWLDYETEKPTKSKDLSRFKSLMHTGSTIPQDVYSIPSDKLMELLELKAKKDHPRETNVHKYVPKLLHQYLDLGEAKDFSVSDMTS